MKDFTIEDIAYNTSMPLKDVENSFGDLKNKGLLFTKANSVNEVSDLKPFRLAGKKPFDNASPSSLSLGPFCLKKEVYETLYNQFKSELETDAWKLLLAFQRIQYEQLGTTVPNYSFQLSDAPMIEMLHMIDFWNIENPLIYDLAVWIEPNIKAKNFAEEISGKTFSEDNFIWWDILVDFGENFLPSQIEDYPDKFTHIPDGFHKWGRYLPIEIAIFYHYLCYELKSNSEFSFVSVKSSSDLITLFEKILNKLNKKQNENESDFDKKVLLKELYDFNSIKYPLDANSIFDFFIQIGFIKTKKRSPKIEYYLNNNLADPNKMIKFPKGWEERMSEFLETGSILFAYLTVEEMLSD